MYRLKYKNDNLHKITILVIAKRSDVCKTILMKNISKEFTILSLYRRGNKKSALSY